MPRTPERIIQQGDQFGRWTVLGKVAVPSKEGKRRYSFHSCMCECGNICEVTTASLLDGSSTQCRECRNKNHQKKVKVPDGTLVSIAIPFQYHHYLVRRFGNKRNLGRAIRDIVGKYRESGEIRLPNRDYLKMPQKQSKQTSVVLPSSDKKWLASKHPSITDGVLAAIDYYLLG